MTILWYPIYMVNFISKTLQSVTRDEWAFIGPTIALWVLSISYAYYHCVVLGLGFMDPPAMHIVSGTIAAVCTGAIVVYR